MFLHDVVCDGWVPERKTLLSNYDGLQQVSKQDDM